MELLEGETLAQRLKREKRLLASDTARVITHVGRAVGRAHEENIVHRDLKPENVFLVHNDDDEIAKVLDFGVAKMDRASLGSEGTRTRTGSILGTPYYMSPEQAQGNKTVDYRSDLWSLAVIAFECLTGKRPFFSDGLGDLVLQICIRDIPVPSAVASVPLGFDQWFKKGTARDPELRFQSARELIDSLREALGVEGRETVAGPDVFVSTAANVSSVPPRAESATELATARVSALERTTLDGGEDAADAMPATEPEPVAAVSAELAPPESAETGEASFPPPRSDEDERAPAHTIQQFGTTQHSSPPPSRKGGGVLWGVAAAALVIGGGIGFVMVSGGYASSNPTGSERELPLPNVERTDSVKSGAQPAPEGSAPTPAESAAGDAVATDSVAADAGEDATAADSDAGSDAGRATETEGEEEGARDAGTDAWVKPEWARPDDEVTLDPLLEDPPRKDPLRKDPVPKEKVNPYE